MVDQADLEILRSNWLKCGWVPAGSCDFKLNIDEMKTLLSTWLAELDAPAVK